MKKPSNLLVLVLLVVAAAAVSTPAQNAPGQTVPGGVQLAATNSVGLATTITTISPSQAVVNSLSNLPEADTLIYINPQRILNEVVPKLLTAKDVENMRKGFEEVKKMRASIRRKSLTLSSLFVSGSRLPISTFNHRNSWWYRAEILVPIHC